MRRLFSSLLTLTLVLMIHHGVDGQDLDVNSLTQRFQTSVLPFAARYCLSCHGLEVQEGKLDLSSATTPDADLANIGVWEIVLQRLQQNEMPPADATPRPTDAERDAVIRWLQDSRMAEAARNAGDPGPVLARRISNAENDYTVRDLTGVDIRPTKEFPVDPANEAGFDNSGESLVMSPALLQKYLAAARHVADHAVLTPRGIVFAPHPAVSETDRDRFCVQRIVDFYQRHTVDYAAYFLTLWKFQYRSQMGREQASLDEFGEENRLSSRYLATLWETLHRPDAIGPQKELQAVWAALPTDRSQEAATAVACQRIAQLIGKIRADLEVPVLRLKVEGVSGGSQPLILWWNQKVADRRMTFPGDGEDASLDAARNEFCEVFPNVFSVSSRGHYSNAELGANVRLLSAGFHLMQGYFRDDQPLCKLILNEDQRQELEELWDDMNFVTLAPVRQYKDFLFFERAEPPQFMGGAEFDFARAEDKAVTSSEMVSRLRDVYLTKATQNGANDEAVQAISDYFEQMNEHFRWIERTDAHAEILHVNELAKFAERAWRRPTSDEEREELKAFYRQLRSHEGLSHEDAVRDTIATVLMSPYFSYRFELAGAADGPAEDASDAAAVRDLNDYELASRLSYFLWASMPDDELLSDAAAGRLHDPQVLQSQARRMLKDPRIRGLAVEFLGNWLEFRRFEEHNAVDRERFPAFDSELRTAMFEEPVRFFQDLAERDGSLTDLLFADHTFVNAPLAKHYGLEVPALPETSRPDRWIRVDGVQRSGRGGLLPMAVFLTKNSPGLRTSPVKRGYWVVKRLLGEHIPAPPPNVPELPKDESAFGDLTLSELLARHRNNTACAGCHQRFDSMGLVFEGYGPVGERRQLDLGGHPVQTQAVFPNGTPGDGLDDLRNYLATNRRDDFIDHIVRQMFAYALGRSILLSDTQAIIDVKLQLDHGDFRLGLLVEGIVTSPQFLQKRVGTANE